MNMRTPAERLIVAADFKPSSSGGWKEVQGEVLALADSLAGTGVYLKVNSALRAIGYDLVDEIHRLGLRVFADLKLFDIPETLETDGMLLQHAQPELLTVVCATGASSIRSLKHVLPDTEVLGVTVLTSQTEADTQALFLGSTKQAVFRFAEMAIDAGVDGLISSAKEATMLRTRFGLGISLNTPGIRPHWSVIEGDDQNPERVMTPAKAIAAGADRIVIGRPITRADNPYDAVRRTLEEIASATE